ncbi:MAG: sulfotransferase family protein [Gaiellaceae bacterium]
MTLPTFLGVGVPRAGTTWLHSLLASHPDVYMPSRRKEIRFFDRHFSEGLGWYEEFFCSDDEAGSYRAIGEISPQYLYDDECPERISATLPGVKLLLMLRHPVDRAYSTYGFTMQRANFRGSFAEFLESRPTVLERGFYSRYLKRYLERFERERILALVFEESIADVATTRGRLADFLGLDAGSFPLESGTTKVNRSSAPALGAASGFAVKMGRRLRRGGLEPAVDLARRLGVQRILSKGTPIPPLDDETRRELGKPFSDEFDDLERLLGIDLDRWRPAAATRPS